MDRLVRFPEQVPNLYAATAKAYQSPEFQKLYPEKSKLGPAVVRAANDQFNTRFPVVSNPYLACAAINQSMIQAANIFGTVKIQLIQIKDLMALGGDFRGYQDWAKAVLMIAAKTEPEIHRFLKATFTVGDLIAN